MDDCVGIRFPSKDNFSGFGQIAKPSHDIAVIVDNAIDLVVGQDIPPRANSTLTKKGYGTAGLFFETVFTFLCLEAIKAGKRNGFVDAARARQSYEPYRMFQ